MKQLFGLLVLTAMAACNNNNGPEQQAKPLKDTVTVTPVKKDSQATYIHRFADTSLENKIETALRKLSFIKKSNAYIDSFSNHTHGIAFLLDSLGNGEKEIQVQAGYNGDLRFETYYYLYVNPKTMDIKVLDEVLDKKVSVKEFIKTQH